MRHDNIEHRRLRPEPFTVEGDLAFVLRTFGLSEDMSAAAAEDLFCGSDVLTCSITGKPCVITTWQCVRADDGPAFYTVEAQPVQVVAKPATPVDPWVKVGTTTIDGTLVDIANVLDVSSWPIDWDRDAVAAIDLFMRAQEPWLVGGRHLVAQRSHVNEHAGTAIIHCDIVRRQSEIEAEGADKQAEFDREVATMEARDYPHGLPRLPCPECGPHGNRGEVLLAPSWAKCTTCAGGKPGDLWGEVKAHEPATAQEALSSALIATGASSEVAQAGVRQFIDALNKPTTSFMDAGREALLVQLGQGFKVPTLSEMRGAELDNLRRYLTSDTSIRYDDATIAKWANIVCNLLPGDWIA